MKKSNLPKDMKWNIPYQYETITRSIVSCLGNWTLRTLCMRKRELGLYDLILNLFSYPNLNKFKREYKLVSLIKSI